MKHLKKFNESTNEGLDKEYLDMVFVNFLDRGIETKISPNNKVYTIELKYDLIYTIGKLKDYCDKLKEDSLELESCMGKVKIEYPKASYDLKTDFRKVIFKIYENPGVINTPNPEGLEEVEGWDDDNHLDFFR